MERKGEKIALVITSGFSDLLLIGNQARPEIFDLSAKKPGVLYSEVIEIEVKDGSNVLLQSLKNLNFPKDGIVGGVIRNNEAIIRQFCIEQWPRLHGTSHRSKIQRII